ncbi:protein of unknown function [Limnospira indica PCC 8005]|uniref:Uncharacterized protein n=1 Tax=Limnospira indica PCC 8005 TaxID=376219 RepID=A0A9P1P0C0_9CYAN|nr:protein of unknown function [Limnospira indica PCC 8005]
MRINLLPDMSNPRKRPKSLESMKEHSADGTTMAQSRPSEPPLGNDDTTLSPQYRTKKLKVLAKRESSRKF